ncbi:D-amino-acid dehydrogenase [Evansella vedderi]|uniref:D-amino-acid dehydrogenase n=1 Tax=Evansella vedderi TaxID=38282 RepID=A0ABT9ZVC1_9BACI|nr:FAD-binding oxidoreductase [Evansella vedderi]MDQ0254682.1 D-amino-acid dehydrogenase [Evansella vedderi]
MRSFIVVGAGILGASTAYHLAKFGGKVTVVDRKDKGQATDAAAGIVNPWLTQRRNKAWYRLAKGGARYYPKLIKALEEDGETNTGYARVGAISLQTDELKLNKMEERAKLRKEDAPEMGEIRRLSSEETKAMFPPLADGFGAVHVSGGARVYGRDLRNALLRGGEKHRAKVIEGNAELLHNGKRVIGVKVGGQEILSDKVIVTAGAWVKELLAPLGINFLVTGQKAQIIHLELSSVETEKWPVVMPPNNQYILAFGGGRIIAGATHEDDVAFDTRVTAGGIHEILDKALRVAPGLGESSILEARVGFRPFTPEFLPVIGPVPQWEGLLVANGLGASGLTVGPYLGSELGKLALGLEMELDITDYDVAGAIDIHGIS